MQQKAPGLSAENCLRGNSQHIIFESLLKEFGPAIKRLARNYPSKWEDDFFQEGSIALSDAVKKFTVLPPLKDFRPYAMQAVKSRMIDFYRSTIKRSPPTQDLNTENVNFDYDGHAEFISSYTAEPEFETTTDFEIDYKVVFSEESMTENGFSKQEVEVFNLHINMDYTVTEMAELLEVSVGQSSKLLAKTKTKSGQLWKRSNNRKQKHYGK